MNLTKIMMGIFFISLGCTNPEMNFPDEKKNTEISNSPILAYKNPTIIVFEKNLTPNHFFYFYALASLNGAKDQDFTLLKESQLAKLPQLIDSINKTYGKKPYLLYFNVFDAQKDKYLKQVERAIVMDCAVKKENSQNIRYLNFTSEIQKEQKKESEETGVNNFCAQEFFAQKLNDSAFLSQLFTNLLDKELPNKFNADNKMLYLKGKTDSKAQIGLYSFEENKENRKLTLYANKDGFFNPIVINNQKKFFLRVFKNKKEWDFSWIGLSASFSFLDFSIPNNLLGEIHSLYAPLLIEQFIFPQGVDTSQLKEKIPLIYRVQVIKGEKTSLTFSDGSLKLELPGKMYLKVKFMDQEILLKENTTYFFIQPLVTNAVVASSMSASSSSSESSGILSSLSSSSNSEQSHSSQIEKSSIASSSQMNFSSEPKKEKPK